MSKEITASAELRNDAVLIRAGAFDINPANVSLIERNPNGSCTVFVSGFREPVRLEANEAKDLDAYFTIFSPEVPEAAVESSEAATGEPVKPRRKKAAEKPESTETAPAAE